MGRSKKGKCKSVVDVKSLKHKKRYLVAPKKTTQDSSVQFQDTQLKVPLTHTTDTIQQLVMPPSKENEELNNYEFYENEISASSLDEISSDAECSNIFYKDMNFQTLESLNKADKSLEELFEERPLSDTDEDDDESDEAHFNSKLTEEEKLKTELRDWHKKYAVTNVALCALLLILRSHSCFSNLPKSDKSLLHTPRDLKYAEMGPGLYYHIGLVRTLNRVLSFIKEKVTHLRLKIGIDEVPIFKSVPSGMIPILISFSGIQSLRKVVLPIGIYYGPAKASVTKFLKPFVDEATTVLKNGLDFQGSKVKVEVDGFICDTPGKAYILNTKGHRGYSSCTKCKAFGVDYMGRMTFPTNEKITLRTHDEFLQNADEEYRMGETPLTDLPGIDFMHSFPLDTMHIVFLGIVRAILYTWIFAKQPKKLPFFFIDCFSKSLLFLKSYMPCEFNRKGRSMNEIRRWKATEFRTFLLYTSIIALKDLEKDYPQLYFNFLMLHVIMRILLSSNQARLYREYAESLIDSFSRDCERLYGQEFITSNMHNLRHLPLNLERFLSCSECDAFPIENALHSLKKLTRKPAKPLQQTCSRLEEFIANGQWFHNAPDTRDPMSYETLGGHFCGPTLPGFEGRQFKGLKLPRFKIGITNPDYCLALNDGSVIIVRNIVIPQQCKDPVIVGQKFSCYENFFPEPLCQSSMLGIHLVSNLDPILRSWPLSDISDKLVLLPFRSKHVCIPLLDDVS